MIAQYWDERNRRLQKEKCIENYKKKTRIKSHLDTNHYDNPFLGTRNKLFQTPVIRTPNATIENKFVFRIFQWIIHQEKHY